MRLIDADELIESTPNILIMCLGGRSTGKTMTTYEELFKKKVNEAPTVQAVPIEVLDKIRAEIIDKYMTATGEVNTVAKGCLQIIDKYTAESEDKE